MKFKGHETFFIRKGWLSKGMKNIKANPILFVDKENNPMDELGLGSNMVKSLRYWLTATGLTEEEIVNKKRQQKLTSDFGQIIFENDRYLEEIGTLHLIQYKLACNKDDATSWFYFFNKFNMTEFTREDFIVEINKFLKEENAVLPATSSLSDDFNCIVNTYLPRYKSQNKELNPENNIDCPLGELNLIDIVNKKKGIVFYKKSCPLMSSFNPWIILAIINDNAQGKTEIKLNDLLTAERNIGKIFNLDSTKMLELLHEIEKRELLKIIRTSGLDVIQLKKSYSFEECVKNYYKEIAS